jgi:plastocyanin
MKRTILWLLALILAGVVVGCGSNSNNNGDDSVTIRDFAFVPQSFTIPAGTEVVWANAGSTTHTVVSGQLLPVFFPKTVVVNIQDIGFTNPNIIDGVLTVNLGDTVRFVNLSVIPRQVEIKDAVTLQQIFISELLPINLSSDYPTTLGGPGDFTVKDSANSANTFRMLVVGRPDPDANPVLNSGPIQPGQTFSFTFTSPGTFSYFCSVHNIEQGTITVEASP